MDPLSAATAWLATKITSSAINLASDQAKKGAKAFWEEYFVAAQDQYRDLQHAIEKKLDQSVEKTVQQVTENQYSIEATKIVTAFETWTQSWGEGLEDAKKGDQKAITDLRQDFRNSDTGAANRLSLMHNLLMGTASFGGSSGGYLKVLEAGFYARLRDEEAFTIQHYYDSLVTLMARLIRIQLIGFYFRLCSMESPNDERATKWATELQARLQEQKDRVLSCMPALVRKLKPDFETPAMSTEHWWRFINEADRSECLAIVDKRPWYYASGLTHGVKDIKAFVRSDGTSPRPAHEWRFERPLLVDRDPQPQTSAERYPDAATSAEQKTQRDAAFELDFTFLLSRFNHKRVEVGRELKADGARAWHPDMETTWWKEGMWNERLVRFKVVPTKDKGLPTFKLLGVLPTRAKTWSEMDGMAYNPLAVKKNTEWYLEDNGTSQEDF